MQAAVSFKITEVTGGLICQIRHFIFCTSLSFFFQRVTVAFSIYRLCDVTISVLICFVQYLINSGTVNGWVWHTIWSGWYDIHAESKKQLESTTIWNMKSDRAKSYNLEISYRAHRTLPMCIFSEINPHTLLTYGLRKSFRIGTGGR